MSVVLCLGSFVPKFAPLAYLNAFYFCAGFFIARVVRQIVKLDGSDLCWMRKDLDLFHVSNPLSYC